MGSTSDGWLLVFSGVTGEGNRRAREAVGHALGEGLTVVWFDGYRETPEDPPDMRFRIQPEDATGSLTIVDYSAQERAHWLNRFANSLPKAPVGPQDVAETSLESGRRGFNPTRRLRTMVSNLTRFVERAILRRIGQYLRGRVGWNLVKEDVMGLASAGPPIRIVYGDEFALTQAWHSVRLWPDADAVMELDT